MVFPKKISKYFPNTVSWVNKKKSKKNPAPEPAMQKRRLKTHVLVIKQCHHWPETLWEKKPGCGYFAVPQSRWWWGETVPSMWHQVLTKTSCRQGSEHPGVIEKKIFYWKQIGSQKKLFYYYLLQPAKIACFKSQTMHKNWPPPPLFLLKNNKRGFWFKNNKFFWAQ